VRIELDHKQQVIQLIQITDTHLGDQPGEPLLGMDTDQSLAHVLDLIRKERKPADVMLATGDISNCGSVASYQRFYQLTRNLAAHALWLPGNHDSLPAMQQAMPGAEELSRSAYMGNWQVVMLNSTTPGEVGGNFSADELAFLRQTLQNSTARHVLLCLHHHPVTIGCDWLDEQKVSNAEDFFAIIDEFESVRGVLWGHIHQSINQQRKNVKLMATPSSCVQFAANSPGFRLAQLNPGYRWLELHADGNIETGVSRVTGVEFDIDYQCSNGY
jgi:Icc protein